MEVNSPTPSARSSFFVFRFCYVQAKCSDYLIAGVSIWNCKNINLQVVLNVFILWEKQLYKNIRYLNTWFPCICFIHPVTSWTDIRRYLKRLSFGTHFSTCNCDQHVTRSNHELRAPVLSASLIRTLSYRIRCLFRGNFISIMTKMSCCDTLSPWIWYWAPE